MKRIVTIIALLTVFVTVAHAQIVGANEREWSKSNNNSTEYTLRGHYLRLEAGFPNFITAAYGYQITPWIFVGAGGGFGMMTYDYYHYHYNYDSYHDYEYRGKEIGLGFPIYTEFIFSTPKRHSAFFIDLKMGYNFPLYDYYHYYDGYSYYDSYYRYGRRFYSCLNFGVKWGNFGIFGGLTTNSANMLFSVGASYNIPLKVH